MVTDTVADLLTRIRNAQRRGWPAVRIPAFRLGGRILEVLKEEGFVGYVELKPDADTGFAAYEVGLKYTSTGQPLMETMKRVSKPGRRVYRPASELKAMHCGLGIALVSTSQGVLSDREARRRNIGGEVLALIA